MCKTDVFYVSSGRLVTECVVEELVAWHDGFVFPFFAKWFWRKVQSVTKEQCAECLFSRFEKSNPRFALTSELAKNPIDLVSVGLADDSNLFDWEILVMGPDGTLYEGGFFKARLVFPPDFPNMPPTMTFISEMWHPNVYEDGRVCISILHPPGEDEFNSQESADERWRPILGVEQILVSVISMLSDPNDESPANLDAAVMWRNDRPAFKKKVRRVVRKSQEEC